MGKINSISKRITLNFSFLIIVSILFTCLFTSYIFTRVVVNKTVSIVGKEIDIITEGINQQIINIKSRYLSIRSNGMFQELIEHEDALTDMKQYKKNKEIREILRQYQYYDNTILSILSFDRHLNVLDSNYMYPPYIKYIRQFEEFKHFVESGQFEGFSKPSFFPYDTSLNYDHSRETVTYYAQYLGNDDFTVKGYIMINIIKDNFFKNIEQYCKNVLDTTYIVNEKNELIHQIGDSGLVLEEVCGEPASDEGGYRNLTAEGMNYIVIDRPLTEYPKWRVIGVVSFWKAAQDLKPLYVVIAGFCIVCILIVIYLSYRISKGITDPIVKINQAIQSFENNVWPEKIKPDTDDEVKHLVVGFNNLFEYLETLIGKIYNEQEEKKRAEVKSYKLQLQLLQSQINPHFMHNTLNTAAYLALQKGDFEVREVIQSLNALFRVSMNVEKNMILISEELGFINNYLKIQQYRYNNIFTFHCDAAQEVKGCYIPKLILQPLIENSLFHGILPKKKQGTIVLRIGKEENSIEFKVIDDGVGIRKSSIPDIVGKKQQEKASGYNNIGLFNINERLSLCYGEACRLSIYTDKGIGTCIRFHIPCEFNR